MTDPELLEHWQRHRDELFGYVRRMLGSYHDAEDCIQDLYTKVWRIYIEERERIGEVRNIRAWLFTIAGNASRNLLRARWRRREEREPAEGDEYPRKTPQPKPDERSTRNDAVQAVKTCLDKLPEHLRIIIALLFFEDLNRRQAGEALGLPPTTVQSREKRALEKLKACLRGWEELS